MLLHELNDSIERGIRDTVLDAWRREGLDAAKKAFKDLEPAMKLAEQERRRAGL